MTNSILARHHAFAIVETSLLSAPSHLDDRSWNALIGVVTAIVGNILISFALNLQRYAHIRLHRERLERSRIWNGDGNSAHKRSEYGTTSEANGNGGRWNDRSTFAPEGQPLLGGATPPTESEHNRRVESGPLARPTSSYEDDEQKSYLKSPYWWAGIFLMTIGEAGNFLAYGFAPASTVSPLGVVALISNCIIAPCLLHERFRQRDFWGVVIAITGAVTIVLSAKSNEEKMGPGEIWHAISRWEFEVYLGITAAAILALAWASSRYGQKTLFIDLGLVGLFGEYTALSTKGIASLLSDSLWRVITFPITYLLVLVLVFTALMQIRYINRALQRFPSTQVIPTQFVLFTISVIIGSAVLYRDFESTTAERIGQFVGGCVMTFLGVYLITRGRPSYEDADASLVESGEHISLVDEEALRRNHNPRGWLTAGRNGKPASVSKPLSREDTQASGGSVSYQSGAAISAASSVPEEHSYEGMSTPPDTPWGTTPVHHAPDAFNRQGSFSAIEGSISASVPDRSHSLQPHLPENRTRSLARKSMSRMFPNPIVTPLSSSLNGIVVESLRQGIDTPGRRGLRYAPEALPRSDSVPEGELPLVRAESASEAAGPSESSLPQPLPPVEDDNTEERKSRTKALTASLRSLLHPSRPRSRSRDGPAERGARRH